MKKFGYVKMKQPRKNNGKKYTVLEMDSILTKEQMKNGVLITVANHHTCILNGKIIDTWNCGGYTVGNYYVKIK